MKFAKKKLGKLFKRSGIPVIALMLAALVAIPLSAYAASNASTTTGLASQQQNPDNEDTDNSAAALETSITKEQASDIALAANSGATVIAAEFEDENGTAIYAIDLKAADGNVIEVKVDTADGAILSTETDTEDDSTDDADMEEADDPAKELEEEAALAGKATLTKAQANDIALAANQDSTILKTRLGDENGTIIYEVEIQTADGKTSEVKIDAESGEILLENANNEQVDSNDDND